VRVVSPVNAYVFPEYIIPKLSSFVKHQSPLVRATYASCLASLADSSSRFLDMVQALRAGGSLPTTDPENEDGIISDAAYQNQFDVARVDLQDFFQAQSTALLTDEDSSVRRAFLRSVTRLCVFFGSSTANDIILSHLNTYLNDKDWMLKCALFETIVGVATFVGGTSLEEFIWPLMEQALTDPEDFVVERVIRSLASMAELGLFQRSKTWELVDIISRFTMHPNLWIREAAVSFISASTTFLSPADCHCIILPLIRPFLKTSVSDYTEVRLLDALKKPLPRPIFESAMTWSEKSERGVFWRAAQTQRTFSFSVPTKDLGTYPFSKIPKVEEDDQWLARLRNLGMTSEDEWKLVALREYIWWMKHNRKRHEEDIGKSFPQDIVTIASLDISPQTVIFDNNQDLYDRLASPEDQRLTSTNEGPHTIADALMDASMTIDDPLSRRKNPHPNDRAARTNGRAVARPLPISSRPSKGDSSLSPSPGPSASEGEQSSKKKSSTNRGALDGGDGVGTMSSDDASTRTNSAVDRRLAVPNRGLSHKPSAVSLLTRGDASKSTASTGMSSDNAFGKVEGPLTKHSSQSSPLAMANTQLNDSSQIRFRGAHTYEGNDPNVLKLLDSLYLENYPSDVNDFGPKITSLADQLPRLPIKRSNTQSAERPWRPDGTLVSTFGEHTAAINRVIVSPDHAFFVTGSDDSTVKVWDTSRLERNVAHRSRQTYRHNSGTQIKSMCFVQDTHCFVSAASDGSVHVVKVAYQAVSSSTKYGKLRCLREYQLRPNEYAVWMEHFKLAGQSNSNSTLLIATNQSRVVALNLRNMETLYTLENPVHHGTPTCFCIDTKRWWLLLGTSHGLLDLWDLRFQVRVRAWGLHGNAPIHRLCVHPVRGRGKWVCVAGGSGQGEITVWDIEKVQCREVYRSGGTRDDIKRYEAFNPDEEKPEGMLGRFATALEPSGGGSVDRGIRALVVGSDTADDDRSKRSGFMVTGGSDRKIRFWDLNRVEASLVVSGLDGEEPKPSFSATHPSLTLTLNTERVPSSGTSTAPGLGARTTSNNSVKRTESKRGNTKTPRNTLISVQQQQLLRTHLDSITDVALLESPYGMTVSVDRSGIIYIFQ
jgi:phosphoinositide-3-kinase, regulatory subunit 4